MNVKEYWKKLIEEIEKFKKNDEKTPASTSKDENELKKIEKALLGVADHGVKSQESWNPLTVKDHIAQGEELIKLAG